MNLSTLFTWFYCLDYPSIFLLMILATLVYTQLLPRYISENSFRNVSFLLFLCWIGLVIATTLYTREPTTYQPETNLFHSYQTAAQTGNVEIYRSNLMNALLFYPIGLFLFCRSRSFTKAAVASILLGLILSFGIEWCQYAYHLGRPEIDDIFHNVLGALAGIIIPPALQKAVRILFGDAFTEPAH